MTANDCVCGIIQWPVALTFIIQLFWYSNWYLFSIIPIVWPVARIHSVFIPVSFQWFHLFPIDLLLLLFIHWLMTDYSLLLTDYSIDYSSDCYSLIIPMTNDYWLILIIHYSIQLFQYSVFSIDYSNCWPGQFKLFNYSMTIQWPMCVWGPAIQWPYWWLTNYCVLLFQLTIQWLFNYSVWPNCGHDWLIDYSLFIDSHCIYWLFNYSVLLFSIVLIIIPMTFIYSQWWPIIIPMIIQYYSLLFYSSNSLLLLTIVIHCWLIYLLFHSICYCGIYSRHYSFIPFPLFIHCSWLFQLTQCVIIQLLFNQYYSIVIDQLFNSNAQWQWPVWDIDDDIQFIDYSVIQWWPIIQW